MGMFLRSFLSACLYLEFLASVGLPQSLTFKECLDDDTANHETDSRPTKRQESQENGLQLMLARVTFIGETALDAKELNGIARSLEQWAYADPDWTHEVAERARAEWQNRGYFWATTQSTDAKQLSETSNEKHVWLTISVKARQRYRLAGISFRGNTVLSSSELRAIFPIEDGDILDVEKIQQGMESFRKAYSQKGFVNVVPVPSLITDNASSAISLTLEVDEGKKFAFNQVKVLGLDAQLAQKLLQESGLEKGKTFNPWLLDKFVQRNQTLLPQDADPASDIARKWNDNDGTVDITMDFRRCAAPPK